MKTSGWVEICTSINRWTKWSHLHHLFHVNALQRAISSETCDITLDIKTFFAALCYTKIVFVSSHQITKPRVLLEESILDIPYLKGSSIEEKQFWPWCDPSKRVGKFDGFNFISYKGLKGTHLFCIMSFQTPSSQLVLLKIWRSTFLVNIYFWSLKPQHRVPAGPFRYKWFSIS
jgi:hypothetical protein